MLTKAVKIEDLQQEIERLNALVLQKENLISHQLNTIETLYHQLSLFRQARFGRKSEKVEVSEQLSLQFDEIEAPVIAEENQTTATETVTYTRNKKGQGRQKLPQNLPFIEKVYDLTEEEKQCACGCTLTPIKDEITETLDIVPQMTFKVIHIRKKYACKQCEETIKRAQLPKEPIPKSIVSPGLLAAIIDSKFNRHMPLYRQEAMFNEAGIPTTRATLSRWLIQGSKLLEPLIKLNQDILENYDIAYADETPVQVLKQQGKPPTAKSYMWLFIGGPPDKRVFLYQYHPTRSQQVAEDFLQDFKGYLHADAYNAYVNLGKKKSIIHVACLAHARRYFVDVVKISPNKKGLAHEIIQKFSQLYALEKELKESNASIEAIYTTRQSQAKPILVEIKDIIDANLFKILPKSPLGKAVHYFLAHWNALNNYLEDGRLEIDNNLTERSIKPFVIGRKNWLFHGNDIGAKAGSIFYSFIETCKYHRIDPFSWFKYVFTHIHHAHTVESLEKLLPFNINPDLLEEMRRVPELIFPEKGAV